MKHRRFKAGRFALSAMAIATACLWGLDAQALGLGRLNVQSALGEPLRAEIDVTGISPEEAATLSLRVASPEAYKAAGVDYNSILPATQLQLVRRPDGRTVIKVTSDRAVVEPFVDVIVEMTWASGRLVREVTMLFDPPATRMAQPAPAPMTPPVMAAAPAARPAPAAPPPVAAVPMAPAPRPAAPAAPAEPRPPRADADTARAAPPAAGGDRIVVQPGDTLSRIAKRVQPPSVSLDQMLVALFRGNPSAFLGDNMNRLKAGAVLTVPTAEVAQQINGAQAREIIVAQSADFAAYRQQLATGVASASTDAPARQAKGTVQAMVQDSAQPAAAPADKLTLSQAAVKASAPEAAIAKDAAAKDSATRVAELSRNVEDLKQLQAATAQASAPAGTEAAVAAATAAAPAAPAIAVVAPSAPAAEPPAAASAVAAAAPPAKPAPPPAAAAKEPGFFDSLLDNPLLLPGAGVLVALIGGLGIYRLRGRARRTERETSFLESRLQPDSFFGASGGQRIDTHDAPSVAPSSSVSTMNYSLSQLDAIGDVDPVAEADVYLAYGRDLQAEEILKEAMRANPDRLAIRTKLLEVYAKRRDTKGFELLAGQLFALAGADSDDWKKAQELGRQIDADNPLYAPGGQPQMLVREGGRVVEPLDATTMPRSVMPTASQQPPSSQQPPLTEPPPAAELPSGLDLDLDLDAVAREEGVTTPAALEATRPFSTGATMAEDSALLSSGAPAAPADKGLALQKLDFDLGELTLDAPPAPAGKAAADEFAVSLPSFDLGEDDGDALARKLELAEEFRQIGDLEGARDLLEEVIAHADGALKNKAQGMLAKLS